MASSTRMGPIQISVNGTSVRNTTGVANSCGAPLCLSDCAGIDTEWMFNKVQREWRELGTLARGERCQEKRVTGKGKTSLGLRKNPFLCIF